MTVADIVSSALGGHLEFRVEAYDGSVAEPTTVSPANSLTLKILTRDALTRVATHPGELGLARAYVAGDIDLDGDLDALFYLSAPPVAKLLSKDNIAAILRLLGPEGLKPLAPPPIEATPRGLLHSRRRDAQSVSHHYDVSNRFYEMVLGPSMTYSCAVFRSPEDTLEVAQRRKVDLVARKLNLSSETRLLDVGCGWGTMALHAATTYG
ncbi:MAG TPA: class I SAM-dependent methyltransferase, partial [Acidimicrobiales bacterium]|nr:class I SAM-dependent methyltransferase [Acidimicrobiales bacterium]